MLVLSQDNKTHELKCRESKTLTKLDHNEIQHYLDTYLQQWNFDEDNLIILRRFEFKNFKQTMFFINAVAFFCEKECHHPDAKFGYNYCEIGFSTHDVGGVSINDIILAHKIDMLY